MTFELKPLPADVFADEHEWMVVDVSDAIAELGRLRRAARASADAPAGDMAEWDKLLLAFIVSLSERRAEPRPQELRRLLSAWSANARWYLRHRIGNIQRALTEDEWFRPSGSTERTRTLLLPATYSDRISLMIRSHTVPVAWVMHLRIDAPVRP